MANIHFTSIQSLAHYTYDVVCNYLTHEQSYYHANLAIPILLWFHGMWFALNIIRLIN